MAEEPTPPTDGKKGKKKGGKWYTEMIGPLPAGAWIAVLVGGLGYSLYSRSKAKNTTTNSATDTSADPLDTSGLTSDPYGLTTAGAGPYAGGGGGGGSYGFLTPQNNASWETAAINYLVSIGTDPALAAAAMGDYIGGYALSSAEQHLVDLALMGIGPLPFPVGTTSAPSPGGPGTGGNPPPQIPPPVSQGPNPPIRGSEGTLPIHPIIDPSGAPTAPYQPGGPGTPVYGPGQYPATPAVDPTTHLPTSPYQPAGPNTPVYGKRFGNDPSPAGKY